MVSSLQLAVDPLDHWDYHWMANHEGHTDPPPPSPGPDPDESVTRAPRYDPAEVLYGPLPAPDMPDSHRDKAEPDVKRDGE